MHNLSALAGLLVADALGTHICISGCMCILAAHYDRALAVAALRHSLLLMLQDTAVPSAGIRQSLAAAGWFQAV